jgi:hypothetical protein
VRNADRKRLLAGAVLACIGVSSFASSAPVTWTGSAGNLYNDSTKWTPAGPPGTSDVAVFNNSMTGNVNFNAATNPQGMLFSNASGAINLALAGNTLTMGSATTAGSINLGSAAGQVNDVTIGGGAIPYPYTPSTSVVTLKVGFSGSHGNKLTFSGSSTVMSTPTTASGAAISVGVANSNDNQLIVNNGASIDQHGNINVGVINAVPTSASTGNIVTVNDGTLNASVGGNRGINLFNGTLNLTKAYADIAVIDADDAGNSSTINFNSGKLYTRGLRVDNGKNVVIGDGGTIGATYGISYSGGSMSIGSAAAPADLVISSNGTLTGGGSGMVTVNTGGKLRGVFGAKVAPSIINQPALTSDNRSTGTINFTGAWDNTNIQMLMDVGDFPTAAAAPSPFTPLDFIKITGAFTHGGKVTFDMASFVSPLSSLPVEYKVVSWTSEVGSSNGTFVEFINGGALPYRFDGTGLYLTIPEPTSLSAIGLLGLLAVRRRHARRNLA